MTNLVRRIQFLYFDAGGGHRAAATALKSVIEQEGRPWEVTLVNVQEVLHSLDVFRKLTGIRLEDIYNLMLAKGWTLGAGTGLKFMHGVIRAYHAPTTRMLTRHFRETKPDLVVSLIPNFNRAISESVTAALPGVPIATVITDFADYPPHFWIERARPESPERYVVCGTDRAAEQAKALGYDADHVFRTSGMILRPKFYEEFLPGQAVNRAAERQRLGLDPDRPTGLVLFGGQGSRAMVDIAKSLTDTQLIMICGKNEALASKLKALPKNVPRHVEGFTSEIPHFMRLADFFIGKPGPGSISEAIAMHLPVIVESNAWTLPQERYNAEWVQERGVGMVLPNFRGIRKAVETLQGSLDEYRERVAKIQNRAVFEIPNFLGRLLE